MDNFFRPLIDTLTFRRQKDWKSLRGYTEILGNAYIQQTSVPMQVLMKDAVRGALHRKTIKVTCPQERYQGTCFVDIERSSGDESGAVFDLRIKFEGSGRKAAIYFRWGLWGPLVFQTRYAWRPVNTAGGAELLAPGLANAVIDALDSFVQQNGLPVDLAQTYQAQGWSGPTQALDLTFDGSVFLSGGRHGMEFLNTLSEFLDKTVQSPRTTDQNVTWVVQIHPSRKGGFLTGVLLCEPLYERRLKTFYSAISCVVALKPASSLPNHRPALKLSFGLIGDLQAATERFSLYSVVVDLARSVERTMISSGAVVCGDSKDIEAAVEFAFAQYEAKRHRQGAAPPGPANASSKSGFVPGATGAPPLAGNPRSTGSFRGISAPPLTTASSGSGQASAPEFVVIGRNDGDTTYLAEPETAEVVKRWPSAQDFCEAVQMPEICFDDALLQGAVLDVDHFGLPRVASGAFACVFRLSNGEREWAVRCFTTRIKDQLVRYERISRAIQVTRLPYTVDFEFLEAGLRLDSDWYPILKMHWVQGVPLNQYVENVLEDPVKIASLRKKFLTLLERLHSRGIAHGDLQHGNIMLRNDELVLLDYDGMFVPSLKGFSSLEKGHPNYQHPARGSEHFDHNLDNFSGWLIDGALLALEKSPELWHQFGAGDESLLFRGSDLLDPQRSRLFEMLRNHRSSEVAQRAQQICTFLSLPLKDVPPVFVDEHEASTGAWQRLPGHLDEITLVQRVAVEKEDNVTKSVSTDEDKPWWVE